MGLPPETYVEVADGVCAFSPRLVGAGLARLWAVKGSKLEPILDGTGSAYVCPITLANVTSPVLLDDGVVYEEAQICEWLRFHDRAPYTNAYLSKRRVLRLQAFRDVIEQFLLSSKVDACPSQRLEQETVEAESKSEIPLHTRVSNLEASVARSAREAWELQAKIEGAEEALSRLRGKILAKEVAAASVLQGAVRARSVREKAKRTDFGRQQGTSVLLWQGRLKSYDAANQLLELQRESEALRAQMIQSAVLQIQRWWRLHLRRRSKALRRRRQRQKKKTIGSTSIGNNGAADATTANSPRPRPPPATTAAEPAPKPAATPTDPSTSAGVLAKIPQRGGQGLDGLDLLELQAHAEMEGVEAEKLETARNAEDPCGATRSLIIAARNKKATQLVSSGHKIRGVIQQYVQVQLKEKPTVLGFFLNQLQFGGPGRRILIFVRNDAQAAAVKSTLLRLPTLQFPIFWVKEEWSPDHKAFMEKKDSAAIISNELVERGFDIKCANYVLMYDVPDAVDSYLKLIGEALSCTSFPSSDEDLEVIRKTEAACGVKMKAMPCLTQLAMSERRVVLKRRLEVAVRGGRRK